MATTTLQKAEMDRDLIESEIIRLETKILDNKTKPFTLSVAKTQQKKVDTLKASLVEAHSRIMYQKPVDINDQEKLFSELSEKLDTAASDLLDIFAAFPTTSTPPPTHTPHHTIKLPEIHLPNFEGRFEDWPAFSDLFKASVGSNPSLSPAQKLYYLKSCVKGEPAEMIKSFIIIDSNYNEAWQILLARYDNPREILHSLIKKLLYQQHLKSESVSGLQSLLNTTQECVRNLKTQGEPVDAWDSLLAVSLIEKLDPDTKSEWARTLKGKSPATFQEVTDFVESHIRSLVAKGNIISKNNNASNSTTSKTYSHPQKQARTHHTTSSPTQANCFVCESSHTPFHCSEFIEMDTNQRKAAAFRAGSCFNCLRGGHSVQDCRSKFTCQKCNGKHHTLLHSTENQRVAATNHSSVPINDSNDDTSQATVRTNSSVSTQYHKLLKTAIVEINDNFGRRRPCRVFLDEGSDADYISEKCAASLGLRRERTDVVVEGIAGCTAAHIKWKTFAELHSIVHTASVVVEDLFILPNVTGDIPRYSCESSSWSHIQGLQLADPTYSAPGEVDILLGSGVVPYILRDGRKTGSKNQPVAQNSIFGWILSGNVEIKVNNILRTHIATCKLDELVHKFWELEKVPNRKPLSIEEVQCENHFTSTHTRNSKGRYIVRLPVNSKITQVGETRELALSRLHQLEKRFRKNPSKRDAYNKFMKEYLELGHMELAVNTTPDEKRIFIPHHFVTKEDSSTTKLRVVFDASMKSSTGIALNDALQVGPTVQEDLFTLLVRFQTHLIALKADVAKMYRQFEVHPDDRSYQMILWRESESEPVTEYKLKTVTCGTACAPFLATRCLLQLAHDEKCRFPEAAAALLNSSYVDDFLGGSQSLSSSMKLYTQLIQLCEAGGMQIRKWCSSSGAVLSAIPPEMKEEEISHDFDFDSSVKALGIKWKPKGDYFYFEVRKHKHHYQLTKREILSEIARTFDPIGWLTPTIIIAKIIFQDLWKESTDWDQPVEEKFITRWNDYSFNLQYISQIKINRNIIPPHPIDIQLHGFSDASETALAAAVYIRCVDNSGNITTRLITSRSRVAPLRQTSVPRLELCAAHLLSELMESVMKCYDFKYTLHAWTDSMITLGWIVSPSRRWKTFVANRVALIQDVLPPNCWNHVIGTDNPADLPTRGTPAPELVDNSLWWYGPAWLSTNSFPVSSEQPPNPTELGREEKTTKTTTMQAKVKAKVDKICTPLDAFFKFSSLTKTISAAAWIIRYINYLHNKKQSKSGPLTPAERANAQQQLIRTVQNSAFAKEICNLRKQIPLPYSSMIRQLNPYIDGNGILRVGGRIQNSQLGASTTHPIIIPAHHELTTLLVRYYHLNLLHGGFTLTLSMLRRKYCILRCRDTIRNLISKCITCRKMKAEQSSQLMGNLPPARVTPHRPFLHTGVDFAGPIQVKHKKGRGVISDKWYMCVFVCFSTKAVHLEAVSGMTASDFIACYNRFVSRRGISSHLYSDCGKNFIGANKELQTMLKDCEADIQQQLSLQGTKWTFNPPSAPHQGGLWQAAVKSAKYHIKRVVGSNILTIEQFITLLCNVEACLNSRPLSPMSPDPTDCNALTPGHFLIGEPLISVPEPDLTMTEENRLDYWQLVQQMSQHFWKRWKAEYLTTLQQRQKWTEVKRNLQVGDLVVIREDVLPPSKWKLGRVIETFPGEDGLVRKATVKTETGELFRPIAKLCILLFNDE